MKKYLGLSQYHSYVIILYGFVTPFLLIIFRDKLHYDFNPEASNKALLIFVFSLCVFLYLLFIKNLIKPNLKFKYIFIVIIYSILFAFPEEIIFRGIIQTFIQEHLANIYIVVIFSSLIFGMAHLLNGTDFYPPKLNWDLASLTFLAGLPLGLMFALTNSLLLSTILHALFIILLMIFPKNN